MAGRPEFPKMEEDVLASWKEQSLFEKIAKKPATEGRFVFFEGPPTANGKPGIHHIEARAYKDVLLRYKTMQGFEVLRKAGWDTHGLPVELQVEKKLGISGKPQIEDLVSGDKTASITKFNQLCKESVWEYLEDWKAITERIGFWLDLERPYVTYQNEYIESLWWIVKQISDRGLLYRDYKVVPYCTRCGTPLSSHELAQGYDEIEDTSVYVKFKVKNRENTYLLAWTTTPWTLPGNVALAVGENVEYVKVRQKGHPELREGSLANASNPTFVGDSSVAKLPQNDQGFLILAKSRLSVLEGLYEIVEEYAGKDLVGWEYEPLYSFVELDRKAHYVATANFVSTEDGTGIVHTAVMYGADDFELGQKLGLPKKHLVDLQGTFIAEVIEQKPEWRGIFVRNLNAKIIEDLGAKVYRTEVVRHTYPFCWRCKTPLLYYAKESWFVKMSALRDELIASNQTINWHPSYIKDGRFGEWLREVKDWAFSRERYWGTPLPVWVCEEGHQKVIGGFNDFPLSTSGNSYHIMRHGEAENNVAGIITHNSESHLTARGKEEVAASIEKLKKQGGVDIIFASPVMRTTETAELVKAAFPNVELKSEAEFREIEFGIFEGKTEHEYNEFYKTHREHFDRAPEGGETLREVARRMVAAIKKIDAQYSGKRILIVSHGDPLWMIEGALRGLSEEGTENFADQFYMKTGEMRSVEFRQLPFGPDGMVDPHRPFVDGVTFPCEECGKTMQRTPEVIDVWFDSGSMPFAQWHYPFENQQHIDRGEVYPAEYISEAIDQTRGWFYTLLAVATLLGKEAPFKNVICLGHIVDTKGKKMSKSIGNVVDPWEMINQYGADAVRFFMYTISQPGDTKRFDPQDLDRIVKQTFMILWNVLAFWKLYVPKDFVLPKKISTTHMMDQWMMSRLNALIKTVTERLDAYDVTTAGRAITAFINDLSTWYVRRSRDRFKMTGTETGTEAVAVLARVLLNLSQLMAPLTPFLAEGLYREVSQISKFDAHPSVHLDDWPKAEKIDAALLGEMEVVRHAAELGHALRAEQGLKVRQPLADCEIEAGNLSIREELLDILADELNVKQVHVVQHVEEREGYAIRVDGGLTVGLCTVLTPELRRESQLRELVRQVNDLRKESKLTIEDRVNVYYETSNVEIAAFIDHSKEELKKSTLSLSWQQGKEGTGKDLDLDGDAIRIGIIKQ